MRPFFIANAFRLGDPGSFGLVRSRSGSADLVLAFATRLQKNNNGAFERASGSEPDVEHKAQGRGVKNEKKKNPRKITE